MAFEEITQDKLIRRYCEKQEQTHLGLLQILEAQADKCKPEGFMLLECQMMDGFRFGELVILPFGPNNTFKKPPTHPISPRGLASDMSVVVAVSYRDL